VDWCPAGNLRSAGTRQNATAATVGSGWGTTQLSELFSQFSDVPAWKKRMGKGLLDRHFHYATTKCLALYLVVAVALGAWFFAGGGGVGSIPLFIVYNLVLAFVALLAFAFQFDISWL